MSTATDPSILSDVVSSVFEPGTNKGLIAAMQISFALLFVVLSAMLWLTSLNIHVMVMFGLSLASFASMTWYVGDERWNLFLAALLTPWAHHAD